MKIMNMKFLKNISLIICALIIFSCQKTQLKDDSYCDDFSCMTEEPYYTNIEIDFSRTEETPNPIIYIAKGYYEDENIVEIINTDTVENYYFDIYVNVAVNFYYTVYTRYRKDGEIITAIDGKYVYKESYEECDYYCWRVKNKDFNIRLKKF